MASSKSKALLVVCALVMLAAAIQAYGLRAVLQPDPLGLRPCSLQADAAAKAANCPHDGQLYQVCLLGPALGECRLESLGLYPEVQCNTLCSFQSGAG